MTEDGIAICNEEFDEERPPEPTAVEIDDAPNVKSLTAVPSELGIAVKMVICDNEQDSTMTLFFNPVAARHLAAWIRKGGREEGWLDEYGSVIAASPDTHEK
jgi:hypothetical protein